MLPLTVVLVTGNNWLTASVAAENRRLQEILNDKSSEFLTLTDVRVFTSAELVEPIAELPRAVVPKASITLAMLPVDTHEAPRKRVTSFVRKESFDAYMTVQGLEVKGYILLVQRLDPLNFLAKLAQNNQAFFPVVDSTVSAAGPYSEASNAPVTLVNRLRVDLFFLADSPSLLG